MKRFAPVLCMLLCALLLVGCAVSGTTPDTTAAQTTEPAPTTQPVDINIAALKGPTGIGLVQIMAAQQEGTAANNYTFTLSAAPDEITGKLINGELDIAAVPTNLAAVLYNKTQGKIRMAAVNTLGVLYILERGDSIQSLADLKGKTIGATGQGATPEYALNYLLEQAGIADDVNVVYYTEHAELASLLTSGQIDIAMLPEPFVTSALTADSSLRIALDLNEAFEAANSGTSSLVMGCIVVRSEFADAHPEAVQAFLNEAALSANWVNANPAEAAQLCEQFDVMKAAVAEKAIPTCNIVCLTGDEMKSTTQPFLQVLFDADPKSIGGAMPNEDFYLTTP